MTPGPGTLNVADAAIAGGDPNLALSITQSVLSENPGSAEALVHEGDAYYALSRCPAAQAAFQLALKADPKSAPAETGLGRCLLKTDPAAAAAALALAVQDDPGSAAAFNDLGIADDLQGDYAAAAQAYGRALAADPAMSAVEVNLGLSLALSGNGPAALQYLGPLAGGQNATPKIREDYAAALVASGRQVEARTVLAVDLTPDQVNAALTGFNAVIAGSQVSLAAAAAAQAVPPPPTTSTVQTSTVSTTPLAPVPLLPAPATPRPLSMAAPPAGYTVQLAAADSAMAATQEWRRLDAAQPELFNGRQQQIQTAAINGRMYYRLRTGNFSTRRDAARFCTHVEAAGCPCLIADF